MLSRKPPGWKPDDPRSEVEREGNGQWPDELVVDEDASQLTIWQERYQSDFITLTPCASCKHRSKENSLECAAFPDGIPEVILNGDNQHRAPFPGDHGILYQQINPE